MRSRELIFDGKSIVQVSFKSSDLHTRLICTHSAILAFMRDARFIFISITPNSGS